MGNNSTKDTSDVTSSESNDKLLSFGAFSSWLWNDVFVEHLNGFFKARKLHHSVWDLSEPEWFETFVEWVSAFFGHFSVGFSHVAGVTWHGLDSDFHGFEWSQEHVSEEFSTGRGGQVQGHSVGVSAFFTNNTTVQDFKPFVKSEFTDTLSRVTDHGWSPTFDQTFGTVLSESELETVWEVLVFSGVNLKSAFDEIEWGDRQVGETAREHTAESAEAVELGGSDFARVLIGASDGLDVSHFLKLSRFLSVSST